MPPQQKQSKTIPVLLVMIFVALLGLGFLSFKDDLPKNSPEEEILVEDALEEVIYDYGKNISVATHRFSNNLSSETSFVYNFLSEKNVVNIPFSSSFNLDNYKNLMVTSAEVPPFKTKFSVSLGGDSVLTEYNADTDTFTILPPDSGMPVFSKGITKEGYSYNRYGQGDSCWSTDNFLIRVPAKPYWLVLSFETSACDEMGEVEGLENLSLEHLEIVNSIKFK